MLTSISLSCQSAIHSKRSVLFEVEPNGPPVSMEPILEILAGKLLPAPNLCENDSSPNKIFQRKYLKRGTKYRVLAGGAEAGTLTVGKQASVFGYEAKLDGTKKTTDHAANMLATNDTRLGRQSAESYRRTATHDESGAAITLAKDVLRLKGAKPADLKNIQTKQVTAVRVEKDGTTLLVGTFEVPGQDGPKWSLFLIASRQDAVWVPRFVWHQKAKGETTGQVLYLVDQVDLDGDGVDEFIVRRAYYEDWSYEVYKQVDAGWKKILATGIHGCL